MLIVSQYRDYYDTIAKLGVDKTCIYKRTETILKGTFELKRKNKWRHGWPSHEEFKKSSRGITYEYQVGKYVIGFCGELYPFIAVEKNTHGHPLQVYTFFSQEKLVEFLKSEQIGESSRIYYSDIDFSVTSEASMKNFFSTKIFAPLKEEFHKNKCPVFLYGNFKNDKYRREDRLVLNPKLKDYRFFQVKDPQTAFQDIFMFISGVLGIDAPEMVELSDKEMAKKRGHDSPYSFRKPPGKRGKKQWR